MYLLYNNMVFFIFLVIYTLSWIVINFRLVWSRIRLSIQKTAFNLLNVCICGWKCITFSFSSFYCTVCSCTPFLSDFSLSCGCTSSPLNTKAAFNLWVLGGRGSVQLLYLLKEVKKQMVSACEAVCFERPGGERLSLRKVDLFYKIKAKGF